jgi:sugar lactone lactonase YvrE
MRCRVFAIAILLSILLVSIAAWAVTPQFWENFRQEDLLKGSFNHVSLSSEGKLYLAPAYDLVYDTGQPYIFSMVRDKAGNLYLGTGDEGRVFRIDPQGKGSLYYQSKELEIFAMALDATDTLYIGTSPDGKVYKVTGPNQATEFCNPGEKYIWSMIFDSAGNLYVGTGGNGTIYKVDKSGKKTSFYTCGDNHVMCLVQAGNNNLMAGTSPGGLVVEINPEGKGFTVIDTQLEEIHSLVIDRFGTIYAIASGSLKGTGSAAAAKTAPTASSGSASSVTATVASDSMVATEKPKENKTAVTAPGGEKDTAGAKSAVYAISRDGGSETIYSSNEQNVFDAALRNDGSLWLATGSKGRLLSIDLAKQVSVITDSPEEQLTKLILAGDAAYVAASNQGKVYRVQAQKAQTGTFESKALDAKTVASWGKISWQVSNPGSGSVEISTRSGNTEKTDNSWSDWSAPYQSPGQQIASPRARYLQWRAYFKPGAGAATNAPSSMLDRVQIAYLQQNLRPQITSIEVLPYGVELQKQSALALGSLTLITPATTSDGRALNAPREHARERQPMAPRQVLQIGAQSFTWKATDDNEDTLEYALYFKGEGETDWKLLEKKLSDAFYTLNTASLPDGSYRLKVVVSDAPSNPYDKFLIGELISDPFMISNTSPFLEVTGNRIIGKKVEVLFRARVPAGRIATAEFSIDGGEWSLVFPGDGIADSSQEDYRAVTPELLTGEHLIGLRASDANGVTGTTKLLVKIP